MPQAFLDITPELLTQICKGIKKGGGIRNYRVLENGLPLDTEVVECTIYGHPERAVVRMVVESSIFVEGAVLPAVILQSVEAE